MDSKIIDGKTLAKKHEEELKDRLKQVQNKRRPTIVSFCNREDPPSVKYTEMKSSKAADIGMDFITEDFTVESSKDEIIERIRRYNGYENIDGILVQLPLPKELNTFQEDLLHEITPQKDIDGLVENSPYLSATVRGVISILNDYVHGWTNKKIGIVGASGEVGKPLTKFLQVRKVKLTLIDRSHGDLQKDLKDVDIVISATGAQNLIKADMVKNGVVLIDVGLGDFEAGALEKSSLYTPKIGGVGPMTVISLMENAVESYIRRSANSNI